MDGKVVLVTGATSGLGLAAAEGFARLGATVWLVVRSEERGERARAVIAERSGNDDVHVGLCDLSELQSVRQFAGALSQRRQSASTCWSTTPVSCPSTRALSPDGIELTLATNVLGPFLLTNLLMPLLERQRPGADHQRLLRRHVHAAAQGRRPAERARRVRRGDGVRADQARAR